MRIPVRALCGYGCAAAALLLCCTAFPTRFERIEEWPKVIDFEYRNTADSTLAEAAPGDTLLVSAWLSGPPITSVRWELSEQVYMDFLGQDTAMHVRPMVEGVDYQIVNSAADDSLRAFRQTIRYVVPRDIIRKNIALLSTALDAAGQGDEQQYELLLNVLDTLGTLAPATRDSLVQALAGLLDEQHLAAVYLLCTPIRFFVTVNGNHRIRSTVMVRYNRHLAALPQVRVNRNPVLNVMALLKVRGENVAFSATGLGREDTAFILRSSPGALDYSLVGRTVVMSDTVTVDTGFSYFLVSDTGLYRGIDLRDSGTTVIYGDDNKLVLGTVKPERWQEQWFFQPGTAAAAAVDNELGPKFTERDAGATRMRMPVDTAFNHAWVWLQKYDTFSGEPRRPDGSIVGEAALWLRYTPAYIDKVYN